MNIIAVLLDLLKKIFPSFFPTIPTPPLPLPPPDTSLPDDIFSGGTTTTSPVMIVVDPAKPNLPARSSFTTGSQFAAANMHNSVAEREANILKELLAGNFPDFLRTFVEITVSEEGEIISYFVQPDVMAIGVDDDFIRIPVNGLTAGKVAQAYGCSLPTSKIVTQTWKAAKLKLEPSPNGPPYDSTMQKTSAFLESDNKIKEQFKVEGAESGVFVSGIKKDIVLTNQLAPNNPNKRLAIFGWYRKVGSAIQFPVNGHSHEVEYTDYSSSIRLVSSDVMVNGKQMKLQDVFADPKLCKLVSDEGVLKFLNY